MARIRTPVASSVQWNFQQKNFPVAVMAIAQEEIRTALAADAETANTDIKS